MLCLVSGEQFCTDRRTMATAGVTVSQWHCSQRCQHYAQSAVNTSVQTCALNTAVSTAAVTVSQSVTQQSALSAFCPVSGFPVFTAVYVCVIKLLRAAFSVPVDWLLAIIMCFLCAQNEHTALCSDGRSPACGMVSLALVQSACDLSCANRSWRTSVSQHCRFPSASAPYSFISLSPIPYCYS